jgi:hypothetical protein
MNEEADLRPEAFFYRAIPISDSMPEALSESAAESGQDGPVACSQLMRSVG